MLHHAGMIAACAGDSDRAIKLFAESADTVANDLRRELLRQCEAAEYAMRTHQVMSFFVPEHRGHDDLLNAAALVVQAQQLDRLRTATGRGRACSTEIA